MKKVFIILACLIAAACTGKKHCHAKSILASNTEAVLKTDYSARVNKFISSLKGDQKKNCLFKFDSKERTHWHYIPKKTRPGLRIDQMSKEQLEEMYAILGDVFTDAAIGKFINAIESEKILKEFEGPHRDAGKYYFAVFGTPGKGTWGIRFEGHHLSVNVSYRDKTFISATPMFLGANPARIPENKSSKLKKGQVMLATEEKLAYALVNSLTDDQKKKAIIEKPDRDMKEGHKAKPADLKITGIKFGDLNKKQQNALLALIKTGYTDSLQPIPAARYFARVLEQKESLVFTWKGSTEALKPHVYTVYGKTLVIQLYNTQNGTRKTPVNHVHAIWRDKELDFNSTYKFHHTHKDGSSHSH